jgi:23S rRNA (pseudouridine1915-N3)-methyltransferase
MKIQFWSVGKAHDPYVKNGVEEFTGRIKHYFPVSWNIIPVPKNAGMLSEMDLKLKEAETILDWLHKDDHLVVLDEKGKTWDSRGVARYLQRCADEGHKNLIFLIGGAYGLHDSVIKRAQAVWSLSPLTFPHQLVRLILAEQVYRACTILRNEKYHHG